MPGTMPESDMAPTDLAQTRRAAVTAPNDLESYWLPFTPNRSFKRSPRLIVRAKDMHYYSADNRPLLDGTAGLWCTNAGQNPDPAAPPTNPPPRHPLFSPRFPFAHPPRSRAPTRAPARA